MIDSQDIRKIVDRVSSSVGPDVDNRDALIFILSLQLIGDPPDTKTAADYPEAVKELLRWTGFLKWKEDKSVNFDPIFGYPMTDWYAWFAWHPVHTLDRGWRWLVPVQRRRIQKKLHLDGGADQWFQHAVKPPK